MITEIYKLKLAVNLVKESSPICFKFQYKKPKYRQEFLQDNYEFQLLFMDHLRLVDVNLVDIFDPSKEIYILCDIRIPIISVSY